MFLKKVLVRNFRSLENIEVELTTHVNVIVGPNASGKTTFLEAIRFAKALLAPRTNAEASQAAISLGAMTPFNQQNLIVETLARDIDKPVLIRCSYQPSSDELDLIQRSLPDIASTYVLGSMGRSFSDVADRVAALSTPEGLSAISDSQVKLSKALTEIRAGHRLINLELKLDPTEGMSSGDIEGAAFFAFLDKRLPLARLFSATSRRSSDTESRNPCSDRVG